MLETLLTREIKKRLNLKRTRDDIESYGSKLKEVKAKDNSPNSISQVRLTNASTKKSRKIEEDSKDNLYLSKMDEEAGLIMAHQSP